ncbi:TIGR03016 family PEP-CTERM system-associated outer membrane protein [Desulfomicrobium salsuginis]
MRAITGIQLAITVCFVAVASGVWAEPAWQASVSVSEEFNDNTKEERHGEEDYVTALRPALSYKNEGGRLEFDAAYRGDYRYYARQTRDEEFNHDLRAHALLDAMDSFLFLEASDVYRLVNRDRTLGDASEDDGTTRLVQQNMFTISPYIAPRFGERGSARIGYALSNIWYDDEDMDSKDIHRGFVDGEYGLSSTAALLGGYSYTVEVSEDETVDRHIVYAGGRYAYSENGEVFAKIGPHFTRYRDEGSSTSGLYWDAGLNHDFGVVALQILTGVSFEDDPDTADTYERRFGTVRLTKAWTRTTASIWTTIEDYDENYDENYDERDQRDGGDGESVRRTVLGLNVVRELTSRLTGTVGLSRDFRDDSDDTRRWYANLLLAYAVTERMNIGCYYRFKESSSDDPDEEFTVNRVGVQLTMIF